MGYRLYKEVNLSGNRRLKVKAKMPEMNTCWETLATNLEEFKKIEVCLRVHCPAIL